MCAMLHPCLLTVSESQQLQEGTRHHTTSDGERVGQQPPVWAVEYGIRFHRSPGGCARLPLSGDTTETILMRDKDRAETYQWAAERAAHMGGQESGYSKVVSSGSSEIKLLVSKSSFHGMFVLLQRGHGINVLCKDINVVSATTTLPMVS